MRPRFLLPLSFILILLLAGCQLTPLQPTPVPTLPPSPTRQATPGGSSTAGALRVAVAPEALAV
ncbi:MAG: hypothetical protein FJZ89_12700, partial [Chloroflexi bacterium]|nr:hypothetical protein [Chloroflexota bacterium]